MAAWIGLLFLTAQLGDAFMSDAVAPPVVDGGQTRGVAWSDLDGDHRPDLILANMGATGGIWIYRNRPAGFSRVRPDIGGARMDAEGIAALDVDGDRRPDLLVARTDGPPLLFRNRSGFHFELDAEAFAEVDVASSMVCVADFDADGALDVVVVTRGAADDRLFRNDRGRFRLVPDALRGDPGDGRACAVGYLDGDDLPDLFVGDFVVPGSNPPRNAIDRLYRNRGGFGFERQEGSPAANDPSRTYGASFADWDEDSDDDLFVTNIARTDRNILYENAGGTLRARRDLAPSAEATGPSKGQAWGDYDNDGDLDLYIAEGTEGLTPNMAPFDVRNVLFEQEGGALIRVTRGPPIEDAHISAGVANADFDRDGDLDLFVANWGGAGEINSFYINQGGGRSLTIALEGDGANSAGIGARARLWVRRGGRTIVRRASLWPQSGYGSMNEPVLHFGLGAGDRPRRIEIRWPSGTVQRHGIGGGGRYRIREGEGLTRMD